MKIHVKKIFKEYFEMQLDGSKQFEIRKNDCDYWIGDRILLTETEYGKGSIDTFHGTVNRNVVLTDRCMLVEITCVIDYEQKDGYVVLGTKELCRYTGE